MSQVGQSETTSLRSMPRRSPTYSSALPITLGSVVHSKHATMHPPAATPYDDKPYNARRPPPPRTLRQSTHMSSPQPPLYHIRPRYKLFTTAGSAAEYGGLRRGYSMKCEDASV
jgi:hypothetical protein